MFCFDYTVPETREAVSGSIKQAKASNTTFTWFTMCPCPAPFKKLMAGAKLGRPVNNTAKNHYYRTYNVYNNISGAGLGGGGFGVFGRKNIIIRFLCLSMPECPKSENLNFVNFPRRDATGSPYRGPDLEAPSPTLCPTQTL